jgi:hypothetical protein
LPHPVAVIEPVTPTAIADRPIAILTAVVRTAGIPLAGRLPDQCVNENRFR